MERKTELEELRKRIKGDLYHEDAFTEAIENYKNMTPEEKKALRKGDDLDDIPTSDVEKFYTQAYSSEDEEYPDDEEIRDFYETNRIDLARAFLGKKGGYSMRDLKKFFRQTQLYKPLKYDDEGKPITPLYDEEAYDKETEELDVKDQDENSGDMEDELSGTKIVKKQAAKAPAEAKEQKPRAADGRLEKYSDESDEAEFNPELEGIHKDKLD